MSFPRAKQTPQPKTTGTTKAVVSTVKAVVSTVLTPYSPTPDDQKSQVLPAIAPHKEPLAPQKPVEEKNPAQEAVARGEEWLRKNNTEEAKIAFNTAIKENPRCAAAYCGLAKCDVLKGDFKAALAILEQAKKAAIVTITPDIEMATLYSYMGIIHYWDGRTKEGAKYLVGARDIHRKEFSKATAPQKAEVLLYLACCYLAQGNKDAIIQLSQEAQPHIGRINWLDYLLKIEITMIRMRMSQDEQTWENIGWCGSNYRGILNQVKDDPFLRIMALRGLGQLEYIQASIFADEDRSRMYYRNSRMTYKSPRDNYKEIEAHYKKAQEYFTQLIDLCGKDPVAKAIGNKMRHQVCDMRKQFSMLELANAYLKSCEMKLANQNPEFFPDTIENIRMERTFPEEIGTIGQLAAQCNPPPVLDQPVLVECEGEMAHAICSVAGAFHYSLQGNDDGPFVVDQAGNISATKPSAEISESTKRVTLQLKVDKQDTAHLNNVLWQREYILAMKDNDEKQPLASAPVRFRLQGEAAKYFDIDNKGDIFLKDPKNHVPGKVLTNIVVEWVDDKDKVLAKKTYHFLFVKNRFEFWIMVGIPPVHLVENDVVSIIDLIKNASRGDYSHPYKALSYLGHDYPNSIFASNLRRGLLVNGLVVLFDINNKSLLLAWGKDNNDAASQFIRLLAFEVDKAQAIPGLVERIQQALQDKEEALKAAAQAPSAAFSAPKAYPPSAVATVNATGGDTVSDSTNTQGEISQLGAGKPATADEVLQPGALPASATPRPS